MDDALLQPLVPIWGVFFKARKIFYANEVATEILHSVFLLTVYNSGIENFRWDQSGALSCSTQGLQCHASLIWSRNHPKSSFSSPRCDTFEAKSDSCASTQPEQLLRPRRMTVGSPLSTPPTAIGRAKTVRPHRRGYTRGMWNKQNWAFHKRWLITRAYRRRQQEG